MLGEFGGSSGELGIGTADESSGLVDIPGEPGGASGELGAGVAGAGGTGTGAACPAFTVGGLPAVCGAVGVETTGLAGRGFGGLYGPGSATVVATVVVSEKAGIMTRGGPLKLL